MGPRSARCTRVGTFPLLLVLAVVPGCADLTAIREFGTISAESAAYRRLLHDYVTAPDRLKRFEPEARRADLARRTRERAAQAQLLMLRQAAVVAYMDTLGKLAADDLVVYDKRVDALAGALKANAFAQERDADAFAAIAKVVAKAVSDEWRQKQLQTVIADHNPHLQALIVSLHQVVEFAIARDDVETERAAARNYYTTLKLQARDPAGIAALDEWWEYRAAEIAAREQAALTYLQVLDQISRGHQKLFDGRDHLHDQETLRQMRAYAQDLRRLYEALHDN